VRRSRLFWGLGALAILIVGYVLGAWIYWPSMSPARGIQQPLHYNESYVWPRPWTLDQAAPPVPGPTPFAALWGANTVSQGFTACADHLAMVRVWLAPTRGKTTVRVSLLGSRDPADVLCAADLALEKGGRYYALVFPPVADSRDRRFWVHLAAPSATEDAPVAVRAGYVDAVGGLLYVNEYRTVGDLDFGAYYRGWPGVWTFQVLGERILSGMLTRRISQYKPPWAKGTVFGLLTALLAVGSGMLLRISWPRRDGLSARLWRLESTFGVILLLLLTASILGWRDTKVALGIGESRIRATNGAEAMEAPIGVPRASHSLLATLEFAGRDPEPRVISGRWVEVNGESLPAIVAPGASRVTFRMAVPFGAELRFHYARLEGEGSIAVQVAGEQVWEAMAEDLRWQTATLDLRPWAGQNVSLAFVSSGQGQVFWGNPQVLTARDWLRPYPLPTDEPGFCSLPARFEGIEGDSIELLGYAISSRQDALDIRLYWRVLRPVVGDYTVFVHVLDQSGEISGQHDSRPLRGTYPTNIWPVRRVVEDRLSLPVGQDVDRLLVGLYELESMTRLTALQSDGAPWADNQVAIQVK
jgi:hypothetical protein